MLLRSVFVGVALVAKTVGAHMLPLCCPCFSFFFPFPSLLFGLVIAFFFFVLRILLPPPLPLPTWLNLLRYLPAAMQKKKKRSKGARARSHH